VRIMKINILAAMLILLFSGHRAQAQDIPPPNPDLVINILSGQSIVFTFDTMDKYKDGILGGGQSTFIRIGSIYDWKLDFKADQIMFYGTGNPANTIDLDNVGVIVVSTGTNLDDGSNTTNNAKFLPLALSSTDVNLMTVGSGTNKGYAIRNSFTLNWEMGTRRGNMNPQRMLDQNLAADTYTLNVVLTLSVAP